VDFIHPINASSIQDYHAKVGGAAACMCLSVMSQRCASFAYNDQAAFLADAAKIVDCAYAYNRPRDGSAPGEASDPAYPGLADEMMVRAFALILRVSFGMAVFARVCVCVCVFVC
jgi:hypothetical protein